MNDELLISKISEVLLKDENADIFECLDCGKKFEREKIEQFILHQITEQHFDYEKYKK